MSYISTIKLAVASINPLEILQNPNSKTDCSIYHFSALNKYVFEKYISPKINIILKWGVDYLKAQ